MKNRFYSLIALCTIMMVAHDVNAQCGKRYKDFVFDSVAVSTVTYSNTWSVPMLMDIYQPFGDTATNRPVIILAHGGSFIPPGDRTNDNTILTLCHNFAQRGYVAASIDYRLDTAIYTMGDSATAVTTVLKALSDGKSAIRYFRKDAYTANLYKIDTNIIFVGGNSAGAVLYMHVAYVDSLQQLSPGFQAVLNANGGIDGNSGNAGYSSRINAVVNCAGALNNPAFIGAGALPSANFQGTADGTVPYDCGDPESGFVPVRLCGLGVLEGYYQQFGVNHVTVTYPGAGHIPWSTDAAEMTQVDTTTANFLFTLLSGPDTTITICQSTGIKELVNDQNVTVFPNPVNNQLNVNFREDAGIYQKVQLIDVTGRLVGEKNVDGQNLVFTRGDISSGVYMLKILRKDGSYSVKKVLFD